MSLSALAKGVIGFVQAEFDELEVGEKYGGTIFTLKDSQHLVGGVFTSKKHVSIEFSEGYLLQDPDDKLQGSGKFRRHLKLDSQNDIDQSLLKRLFSEAIYLAQQS